MEDYRLIYVSCSNLTGDTPTVARAVQDLIIQSRKDNADRGVTGILLFSGNHFAQVLEGSADTLVELYSHILSDQRHHSPYTLAFEPIAAREFGDWAMAIRGLTNKEFGEVETDGPHDTVLTPTVFAGNIVQFLEVLLSNKEKELRSIRSLAQATSDAELRARVLGLSSHQISVD
ncbi:MAG: BLUF domain-containing protein [Halieaceae bacterium]|jgi:hypothetical protein|nr:BLUF domain-containing protein [Halieaceae bacterium]